MAEGFAENLINLLVRIFAAVKSENQIIICPLYVTIWYDLWTWSSMYIAMQHNLVKYLTAGGYAAKSQQASNQQS